ncbi:hypothetical protein AHF37_04889 [Paragonimus kellicotti]|nr:hypothetical protein AHF37_04889 [Paragonimus kellicotti]
MSKPFYSRYVCIQCLLAVFSILVTIGGIVLIAVGAFVEVKLSKYSFRNELSVQELTIIIILIGCLLVLTEVFGFYGTSCDKSVKLKIYIGLSSAFLLAELTCGIVSTVMLSSVADRINTNLQLYIRNYYSNPVYRVAVDIFQSEVRHQFLSDHSYDRLSSFAVEPDLLTIPQTCAFIVLFSNHSLHSGVADRINTNLQLYIRNYYSNPVYRVAVDIFQSEFVCCGARSSHEYLKHVPLSCYSNHSLHSGVSCFVHLSTCCISSRI